MHLFFSRFFRFWPWAVLFLLLEIHPLHAGGIQGHVTDENGTGLAYASIFVRETGGGAVSNQEGTYELSLQPGTYTVVFQFMGYQTEERKQTIGSDWTTLDIRMRVQPIDLRMSGINLNGEDPAYTVMRKAIAKASFHRQQVDKYTTRVYIKGSGRILNTPFPFRKAIKKTGIDSTMAFVVESVSLLEYVRPHTIKERVISIRSQGDDNASSPMPFIQSSFYEPQVQEAVSPLAPGAMGYYHFKLESFFMDQGYGINKIKVTPKRPGENVFDGYLYIVEDAWTIYSLSLHTFQMGLRFDIDQVYAPVSGTVWMPVTHKFKVGGNLFGFRFEYNYLATSSQYQVQLNPDLPSDFEVVDEKASRLAAKSFPDNPPTTRPKQLIEGGEISRKELRKQMTDYEKESARQQEAPDIISNTTTTIDSLAYRQDSTYWQLIRPIPLTEQEVKGNRYRDSIALQNAVSSQSGKAKDSLSISISSDSVRLKRHTFSLADLLTGASHTLGSHHRLQYEGLLTHLFFNPVDGLNAHSKITYTNLTDKPIGWTFDPRYAFSRNRLNLQGSVFYLPKDNPDTYQRWEISGGRYTVQFNPAPAILDRINTYQSLVRARNFIRLYEKDYVRVDFEYRKARNWSARASLEWARRMRLENQTAFTFFPPDDFSAFPGNAPFAEELQSEIPLLQKAATLSMQWEWRPWQRYTLKNGKKQAVAESSPTFLLQYKKGISGVFQSTVQYDFIALDASHTLRTGSSGQLDIRLQAGIFPSHRQMGFADFKHFPGNQVHVTQGDPTASYRMLPYYQYSTQQHFAGGFLHHQFHKLAFTQIPVVWMLGIKENLFLNYLYTPQARHFVEVGYGVNNLLRVFKVEAATALTDGKLQRIRLFWGISASLEELGNLFD